MPFEILTPIAAKLNTVTPRVEKHGEDNVSAVSIGLSITGPNTILDHLDGGKLRNALYMAVPDQEQLPGVEPSTPLLRARGIEEVKCTGAVEGWTVEIEHGIDDASAIVLGAAKVDKFRVKPMEGGSVVLLFRVGTSDISEHEAGVLFGKLGQEVMLTLRAPVKADGPVIDGTTGHPGLADSQAAHGDDATDLFAAGASDRHAGDFGDADGAPGAGDSDDAGTAERGENWPFPGGDGAASGADDPAWPAEGDAGQGAEDAAEFEAGAKAAIDKATGGRRQRKTRAVIE